MSALTIPAIQKASLVIGKTLIFRDATTSDAPFILSLRTDSNKARHISHTSSDINKQVSWLDDYACKDDQAYFIIENQVGESLGTVRLYDPQGDSFCWGSWIVKDGAPQSAAIESALMVYAYAIDHLGFRAAHFDVRKDNESVWRFHERFGAERVGEDEQQQYLYRISFELISAARQRYRKYLPGSVEVGTINED